MNANQQAAEIIRRWQRCSGNYPMPTKSTPRDL
jgi:hypothetical protein